MLFRVCLSCFVSFTSSFDLNSTNNHLTHLTEEQLAHKTTVWIIVGVVGFVLLFSLRWKAMLASRLLNELRNRYHILEISVELIEWVNIFHTSYGMDHKWFIHNKLRSNNDEYRKWDRRNVTSAFSPLLVGWWFVWLVLSFPSKHETWQILQTSYSPILPTHACFQPWAAVETSLVNRITFCVEPQKNTQCEPTKCGLQF